MDRRERTINVVRALNEFNSKKIKAHVLLDAVCDYFDFIKDEMLDEADKSFLIYLSNKAGVPQYYDILQKFNQSHFEEVQEDFLRLNVISSILYEASLYTDETSKLHQYQMEVLRQFEFGQVNRLFLSASTSFGKTHLVYEVIKKMRYKNVALIFPSIALLSENLAKIKEGKINLPLKYKIHTLSEIDDDYDEYNIFIFTPERMLSFLDKNVSNLVLDFVFVDEIYKIDNGYIIDEEAKENERDIAYRMAIFYSLKKFETIDVLFAGPYIEVFNPDHLTYNPSFDLFLKDFAIKKVLKNEFEIVKVNKYEIENVRSSINLDGVDFDFTRKTTKKARIQEIAGKLLLRGENAIIYCNTKANCERVASDYDRENIDTTAFQNFFDHLKQRYDNRWVVINAIQKGIGIHHGVIPKYIQNEIISLFNKKESNVRLLVSTTTITEGVNTTAKNMIVYKSEKGSGANGKPLQTFDAKNIAGRAGRFMEHYKGRVISLDREFIEKVDLNVDQIKHKNYDVNSDKSEVDYELTPQEFLDDRSKQNFEQIKALQEARDIPESIISQFKVISRRNKIKIYDEIVRLPEPFLIRVREFIRKLNGPSLTVDKDGFQVVLDVIFPIVDNETLKALIENKFRDNYTGANYSILFAALNSYLRKGFNGVFQFYLDREKDKNNNNAVNAAMRNAAALIYNTFKYQLVKYLGVFNLMYKFWVAKSMVKPFEDVAGIDKLIIKLEYNAFTPQGRVASDYGVPQRIIDFYDSQNSSTARDIYNGFDNYEKEIYEKVRKLIN